MIGFDPAEQMPCCETLNIYSTVTVNARRFRISERILLNQAGSVVSLMTLDYETEKIA